MEPMQGDPEAGGQAGGEIPAGLVALYFADRAAFDKTVQEIVSLENGTEILRAIVGQLQDATGVLLESARGAVPMRGPAPMGAPMEEM